MYRIILYLLKKFFSFHYFKIWGMLEIRLKIDLFIILIGLKVHF